MSFSTMGMTLQATEVEVISGVQIFPNEFVSRTHSLVAATQGAMATPAATQALTVMPRFSAALACRPRCGASLIAEHPVQAARRGNEDTSGGDTACVSSNPCLQRGLSFRIPFARGAPFPRREILTSAMERKSEPAAVANVSKGKASAPTTSERTARKKKVVQEEEAAEGGPGDDEEAEEFNWPPLACCFGAHYEFLPIKSSRATGRREYLLAMAMVGMLVLQEKAHAEEMEVVDVPKAEGVDAPKTAVVDAPSLELYVDEKEGFKLLRPAFWNKVEKAGATVLFEDPAKRGNTIGVVVNPVRISSLKDFGTPDVVAEKLIAAERKKPSTNDAQLVRVQERQANGDIPLYCLEYTLDSSRGQKRILSAVTVASKKLYILNITYVDSAATPAPPAMAEAFTQVLNSFDLLA